MVALRDDRCNCYVDDVDDWKVELVSIEQYDSDENAIWPITSEERHEFVAAVLVGLLLAGMVTVLALMT